MTIQYPVFGQDRDKWMYMIDSEEKLNSDLEVIDIENKEYIGWDTEGKPIEFYLDKSRIKVRLLSQEPKLDELRRAILDYAKTAKPKHPFDNLKHSNNMKVFFEAVENHIKTGGK